MNWYGLSPYRQGERRFGTNEAALEFHAGLVNGGGPLEQFVEDDDREEADWYADGYSKFRVYVFD